VCDAVPIASSMRSARLIARLLDLMMPGVGLYYWERKARGSRLIVCWVLYVMGVLLLWLLSPFYGLRLALYIGLPWGALTLWLWHEVGVTPPASLSWVRHVDRVSSSLGLVALAWLPICLTLQLIYSRALMHVRISDDAMFPALISGDLVAVDRRVNRPEDLRLGALVAVECKGVGPRVMRLIAFEPRRALTIAFDEFGGLKEVKEGQASPAQVEAGEPIEAGLVLLDQILRPRLNESDQLEAWLEPLVTWAPPEEALISTLLWTLSSPLHMADDSASTHHLVSVKRYQSSAMKAKRLTLPQGQLLVLPDLRDPSSRAMSCAGVTSPRRLLGEVIYVQAQDRDAYARRRGLSLLR